MNNYIHMEQIKRLPRNQLSISQLGVKSARTQLNSKFVHIINERSTCI